MKEVRRGLGVHGSVVWHLLQVQSPHFDQYWEKKGQEGGRELPSDFGDHYSFFMNYHKFNMSQKKTHVKSLY